MGGRFKATSTVVVSESGQHDHSKNEEHASENLHHAKVGGEAEAELAIGVIVCVVLLVLIRDIEVVALFGIAFENNSLLHEDFVHSAIELLLFIFNE